MSKWQNLTEQPALTPGKNGNWCVNYCMPCGNCWLSRWCSSSCPSNAQQIKQSTTTSCVVRLRHPHHLASLGDGGVVNVRKVQASEEATGNPRPGLEQHEANWVHQQGGQGNKLQHHVPDQKRRAMIDLLPFTYFYSTAEHPLNLQSARIPGENRLTSVCEERSIAGHQEPPLQRTWPARWIETPSLSSWRWWRSVTTGPFSPGHLPWHTRWWTPQVWIKMEKSQLWKITFLCWLTHKWKGQELSLKENNFATLTAYKKVRIWFNTCLWFDWWWRCFDWVWTIVSHRGDKEY